MDSPHAERRNCPNCGGVIASNALVCHLCGYHFKPTTGSAPSLSSSAGSRRLPLPEFRENHYAPPRASLRESEVHLAVGILVAFGKALLSLFLIYLFVIAVLIAGIASCAVVGIPTSSIGLGIIAGVLGAVGAFYFLARVLGRFFSWLWRRPNVH